MDHTPTASRRKGIVLAGGTGSRLWPLTRGISKQLMPVYDKPLVYYPISTLMLAGIREVLVITTPEDAGQFRKLLGDGSGWGMAFHYAVQPQPEGLAQAYLIAADFVRDAPSALVLGDNLFHGHGLPDLLARADARDAGATIFGYPVANPQAYGVAELDASGAVVSLEEKPAQPRAGYAVTGLYFYDETAAERARTLTPSARGELEITDLNLSYLEDSQLSLEVMGRGFAWLDTGTHASLLDAGTYVRITEERQGLKISCPEEIAWRQGFIDGEQLARLAHALAPSRYGEYLAGLLR